MDHVPKVLPSWHDIAFHDIIRQKNHFSYKSLRLPDHGGIGLDLNYDTELLQTKVPKHFRKQIEFAAECCALPFLELKVKNMPDLCSEPIKKEQREFDKFCIKITALRNVTKSKEKVSNLMSLQAKLKEMHKFQEYDEDSTIKVRTNLWELAKHIPKRVNVPKYNAEYAGGNLSSTKAKDHCLLYPDSEKPNNLCITPIQTETDGRFFKPSLSDQLGVRLKNKPILQVESHNELCYIRQKSAYHLLNIETVELDTKTMNNTSLHHIAYSPYNPVEILSVCEKGELTISNMTSRKNIWSLSGPVLKDPSIVCPSWKCSFGSQPFSALCMNEKYLYSVDFRDKEHRMKNLYCIKNPSCDTEEEITAMKQWSQNPFQYFLTSKIHLILCDERYPKRAVMYWNHTLNDYPLYMDIKNFHTSKSVLIIGTQEQSKLSAYFIDSSATQIQPISLSPTFGLSSPTDCIDTLRLHGYTVPENLSMQLAYPLTGISLVQHERDAAFTVFQLTSAGDIFYQDFKQSSGVVERAYSVKTGCVLTPAEKILPYLKDCLSNNDPVESGSTDMCEPVSESLHEIVVDVSEVLKLPKQISANCSLCRLNTEADKKEFVFSDICPTCNLDSTQSQQISEAYANGSLIIGPTYKESSSLNCDMDYLSKFKDVYSKRILDVWTGSDNRNELSSEKGNNEIPAETTGYTMSDLSASSRLFDESITGTENMSILPTNSQAQFDDSFAIDTEEFSELIPSSQVVRPRVEETLYTPAKKKTKKSVLNISSSAGF